MIVIHFFPVLWWRRKIKKVEFKGHHQNETLLQKSLVILAQACSPVLLPLALFVFLPSLLLPVIYYIHLTTVTPPAVQKDGVAGPPAILISLEQPPGAYHDRNLCPICRAAARFQDYAFFAWLPVPVLAPPACLMVFNTPRPIFSNSCFWADVPNLPPISGHLPVCRSI